MHEEFASNDMGGGPLFNVRLFRSSISLDDRAVYDTVVESPLSWKAAKAKSEMTPTNTNRKECFMTSKATKLSVKNVFVFSPILPVN